MTWSSYDIATGLFPTGEPFGLDCPLYCGHKFLDFAGSLSRWGEMEIIDFERKNDD